MGSAAPRKHHRWQTRLLLTLALGALGCGSRPPEPKLQPPSGPRVEDRRTGPRTADTLSETTVPQPAEGVRQQRQCIGFDAAAAEGGAALSFLRGLQVAQRLEQAPQLERWVAGTACRCRACFSDLPRARVLAQAWLTLKRCAALSGDDRQHIGWLHLDRNDTTGLAQLPLPVERHDLASSAALSQQLRDWRHRRWPKVMAVSGDIDWIAVLLSTWLSAAKGPQTLVLIGTEMSHAALRDYLGSRLPRLGGAQTILFLATDSRSTAAAASFATAYQRAFGHEPDAAAWRAARVMTRAMAAETAQTTGGDKLGGGRLHDLRSKLPASKSCQELDTRTAR